MRPVIFTRVDERQVLGSVELPVTDGQFGRRLRLHYRSDQNDPPMLFTPVEVASGGWVRAELDLTWHPKKVIAIPGNEATIPPKLQWTLACKREKFGIEGTDNSSGSIELLDLEVLGKTALDKLCTAIVDACSRLNKQ